MASFLVPEVVVYWDINFGGESWRTNLNYSYVGDHWNDQISSIIVVSGTWQFWRDAGFSGVGDSPWILTPGYYPSSPTQGRAGGEGGWIQNPPSPLRVSPAQMTVGLHG